MNEHVNMANFIAPKSDQLNADDLIGGPRTITVTRVTGNEGNAEQPVNIYFDGDGGKPFRPCKSMRRVMVAIWGADTSKYPGRSMTIYRDPKVKWGGMEVGGIRISHMTELDASKQMALTESKQSRKPYTVQPLRDVPQGQAPTEDLGAWAHKFIASLGNVDSETKLDAGIAKVQGKIDALTAAIPEAHAAVKKAIEDRRASFGIAADDDPFADPPAQSGVTATDLIAKVDACDDLEALAAVEAEFDTHREALGDEAARVDTAIVTMRRALEGKAK